MKSADERFEEWSSAVSERVYCEGCVYFERFGPTDSPPKGQRPGDGTCRRYAPRPLIGGSGTGWSDWDWPVVSITDRCGEFTPPDREAR